jgi:hypothetical protein
MEKTAPTEVRSKAETKMAPAAATLLDPVAEKEKFVASKMEKVISISVLNQINCLWVDAQQLKHQGGAG